MSSSDRSAERSRSPESASDADESTLRGTADEAPREVADAALVAHEDELAVGTAETTVGSVRARKRVESERVEEVVPRSIEYGDFERAPAAPGDSGEIETLPDGSVSVPIFEEELVVTKRLVVRERAIIRKHTVTEMQTVEAELRKERLEIEADPGVEVEDASLGSRRADA